MGDARVLRRHVHCTAHDIVVDAHDGSATCHGVVAWLEYDTDPALCATPDPASEEEEDEDEDSDGAHAAKRARTCVPHETARPLSLAEAFASPRWVLGTGPTNSKWLQGLSCLPEPVSGAKVLRARACFDPFAGSLRVLLDDQ